MRQGRHQPSQGGGARGGIGPRPSPEISQPGWSTPSTGTASNRLGGAHAILPPCGLPAIGRRNPDRGHNLNCVVIEVKRFPDFFLEIFGRWEISVHAVRCFPQRSERGSSWQASAWIVGGVTSTPPSVSASANERTNFFPARSRPIVIVKPDEAVVVCSLAAAFAPAVAGHQTQTPNLSSRKYRNDAIHYVLMSCLRLHQPAHSSGTPASKMLLNSEHRGDDPGGLIRP